jgi:hypothetical protein
MRNILNSLAFNLPLVVIIFIPIYFLTRKKLEQKLLGTIFIVLWVILAAVNSHASQLMLYDIHGKIMVPFDSEPNCIQNEVAYACTSADKANGLSYSASYNIEKIKIDNTKSALERYINGGAANVNARILESKINKNQADTIMTLTRNGVELRMFSRIILKKGVFYTWMVIDVAGKSRFDGKTIFSNNAQYFSVK